MYLFSLKFKYFRIPFTKIFIFTENVTAVAKLYGIEVAKDGVKFMKTDRLGIGFKLHKPLFRIKDIINRNNVIGEL